MVGIREELSSAVYNSLPLVEEADALVRENRLIEKMTRCVGGSFIRHEVNNQWGVALLHHHWNITDDEMPGEDMRIYNNSKEYVTKPVLKSVSQRYAPSLIAFDGFHFQALEFSSDQFVVEAFEVLRDKGTFFAELATSLSTARLNIHFGLVAIRNASNENHWLVEYTEDERLSIVKEIPFNLLNPESLVQTSWIFEPLQEMMPGRCKRTCNRYCSKSSGRHSKAHSKGDHHDYD
jgi:hypothetical protein